MEFHSECGSSTHEVATKASNALGLYDMSGNIYEWCFDWYTENSDRVLRGGGAGSTMILTSK